MHEQGVEGNEVNLLYVNPCCELPQINISTIKKFVDIYVPNMEMFSHFVCNDNCILHMNSKANHKRLQNSDMY